MAHKFNQRQNKNSEPSRKRLLLPSATVQSRVYTLDSAAGRGRVVCTVMGREPAPNRDI
jgi:hypothetical protein